MSSSSPYSRGVFDAMVAMSREAEQSANRTLAAIAVGLGVGQLLFLRWAEQRIGARTTTSIAGIVFLVYAVLVAAAFARMLRVRRTLRPACPQCGRVFDEIGMRIVTASGCCDSCGGEVLEP